MHGIYSSKSTCQLPAGKTVKQELLTPEEKTDGKMDWDSVFECYSEALLLLM
jgi:hypothetical protein